MNINRKNYESDKASAKRMRILISTESGFLRDSISTILHSFRFLTIVGDGVNPAESIKQLNQICPDVILIDCTCTNPCWSQFLDFITEKYSEIKCIAISDTFITTRQALESGAVEVLTYGFTSQELRMKIKKLERFQSLKVKTCLLKERSNG